MRRITTRLTHQERKFLSMLRSVQVCEDQTICFEPFSRIFSTCPPRSGTAECRTLSKDDDPACQMILDQLVSLGYLVAISNDSYEPEYQLTYIGFHYRELRRKELLSDILRSFIFPIIVAFFTAFFTVLLKVS